jgi:excisionase family DNA binding protein
MDPLQNWFEYLDRVSRPVRRHSSADAEPAPAPWRPWMDQEPEGEVEQGVVPGAMPELIPSLSGNGLGVTCQPASREFEDPTIHDELQPIPEFGVPEFRAPAFEISRPLLQPEPPPADGAPEPREPVEAGAKGGASVSPGAGGSGNGGAAAAMARVAASRKLLAGSGGQAAHSLEAREQLVQRLMDPTLTLEETATLLGVCPTTVRRYTNRGVLRHFRTEGNQRRFRLSDVLEFMARRESDLSE